MNAHQFNCLMYKLTNMERMLYRICTTMPSNTQDRVQPDCYIFEEFREDGPEWYVCEECEKNTPRKKKNKIQYYHVDKDFDRECKEVCKKIIHDINILNGTLKDISDEDTDLKGLKKMMDDFIEAYEKQKDKKNKRKEQREELNAMIARATEFQKSRTPTQKKIISITDSSTPKQSAKKVQ